MLADVRTAEILRDHQVDMGTLDERCHSRTIVTLIKTRPLALIGPIRHGRDNSQNAQAHHGPQSKLAPSFDRQTPDDF